MRQASSEEIDSVVEAADGTEALDKLNGRLQVIFSDINMPNVNGIDFLKKLKEADHDGLPVIMFTTEAANRWSWKLSIWVPRDLSVSPSLPRRCRKLSPRRLASRSGAKESERKCR